MKSRILYFEPSTGYGGSSRCLLEWLKKLNKENFIPIVVTFFDGPAIKKIKNLDIKTVKIPYISTFKMLSLKYNGGELISYIIFFLEMIFNILPTTFILTILTKLKKIDLIDINTSIITGIPAILAAKITKIPCVCHIHDTRKLTKKEKFFSKWVNKFIVLTKDAFELYKSELDINKLSVIYNGIDINKWNSKEGEFSLKIRKEFKINREIPLVGILGRIARGKGHEDFIKSAKIINNINPNVKFLVVGSNVLIDKEWEKELKELTLSLGLTHSIIFTGWREDALQIISALDLLVFPTSAFPEGFGLPCIEAMVLEKPVVATNIPGPSEIVLDGVTGFLVPPAKPDILAEKTLFLINNPLIAKNFGHSGRQRVEKLFNIEKCTKEIENIYFEILKRTTDSNRKNG